MGGSRESIRFNTKRRRAEGGGGVGGGEKQQVWALKGMKEGGEGVLLMDRSRRGGGEVYCIRRRLDSAARRGQ